MYKSKLQEYCQSKQWNLPEYSTAKEGLDHCPQFNAFVIVNGSTFATPHCSKSSKEAQNLAAKIAFDHLMGSSSLTPSSSPVPTCVDVQQPKTIETPRASSLDGVNSLSRDHKISKDVGRFYKSQLQTYAQRRNLLLPVYETQREGPPHHCYFKSKVTIDGKTYESPEYFSTVKDAENAAAKVALKATSSDGNGEEDPIFYKNLLQELAQKEYSCLPVYSTLSCGSTHMPRFISTVEVKNESFAGQEAKTKKLAELDAAKVAYNALKDRVNQKVTVPEPDVSGQPEVGPKSANLSVADQSTFRSDVTGDADEPARSDSLKSYKKVKVQPQDPNVTFPPGTVIMHSDTKWVAVTNCNSTQDNPR